MSRIFIGYRHDDGKQVKAIYEHLRLWFDEQIVFLDQVSLKAGEPYLPALTEAVSNSRVFLAVIGQHWYSPHNRTRLADANDITHENSHRCAKQYPDYPSPADGSRPNSWQIPPPISNLSATANPIFTTTTDFSPFLNG